MMDDSNYEDSLDIFVDRIESVYKGMPEPATVLDYGFNESALKRLLNERGIEVVEYDPAKDPDKFAYPAHLVICINMMEYYARDFLDLLLKQLRRLTWDKLFFAVSLKKERLVLAHPDYHREEFWRDKIGEYFDIQDWSIVDNNIVGVCYPPRKPVTG